MSSSLIAKNPTIPSPPYLGAAYYPEAWPAAQVDQDIRLMTQAGINCARIGEFAWSRMEPLEGEFNFGWLEQVIEKLAAAGIATVLCTPTCTPPAWLAERYPETLFVTPEGRRLDHGGRRHSCPNSPVYRDHCKRIVTRLAKRFGRDMRVVAWQIDNEVYPHMPSRACCCTVCLEAFREFLRERFGTIEALNEAWCTALWSQEYQAFEQVPPPRPEVWHHPSLLTAWDEFTSRSYISFVENQAAILHRWAWQPVGTDMMMIWGVDHWAMNRTLDVVQFNHYHYGDGLRDSAFWFDFIRPIKSVPFWNMETATCWSGAGATTGFSEPGFCRVNSWMPIALGAEANLYWLWRTHRAGHELMHGSVVQTCGRPMHMFDEVRETADGFRRCADFLNHTRPARTGLALHASNFASRVFRNQPTFSAGFDYLARLLSDVYHPLIRAQFRPDVLAPEADLAPYSVVVTQFLPALDEGGLRDRLRRWIEGGGIWIAGVGTDIRDLHAAKFTQAPFGSIEEWAGVSCRYQLPGFPRRFEIRWSGPSAFREAAAPDTEAGETDIIGFEAAGAVMEGGLWFDALEPRGAEPLAIYTDPPLAGLAAVTRHRMGKGQVILMGTVLPPEGFAALVGWTARSAGILPVTQASSNLLVVPRKGSAGFGWIAIEMENKPGRLTLPGRAEEILSGKTFEGEREIPPYGVRVFRFH